MFLKRSVVSTELREAGLPPGTLCRHRDRVRARVSDPGRYFGNCHHPRGLGINSPIMDTQGHQGAC
jgi:hypothetical protein